MSQTYRLGKTATTVSTDEGETHVTYHSTRVVTFTWKKVTLHSGGWHTATTKLRMNQAANQFGLGYRVRQRKFDWYVTLPNGKEVPFEDGMTFFRKVERVAA